MAARERPVLPPELPIGVRPDWVCEILYDSNASTDLVVKLRRYHKGGVPHYWAVDPRTATLTVYRHQPEGYLNVVQARKGETVRAEPFGPSSCASDCFSARMRTTRPRRSRSDVRRVCP